MGGDINKVLLTALPRSSSADLLCSAVKLSSGLAPTKPRMDAASFQAKLCTSSIPEFSPLTSNIGNTYAASFAKNFLPRGLCVECDGVCPIDAPLHKRPVFGEGHHRQMPLDHSPHIRFYENDFFGDRAVDLNVEGSLLTLMKGLFTKSRKLADAPENS